ncbi:MAG: helix-turn-helix domain-containing protein [Pigmentiphaga sp.]
MTPEQAKVDPVISTNGAAAAAPPTDPGSSGASLGASLRSLREARGWSMGDISARLKFSPRQIEALEAERWDTLPQGPSLRGLVRNYARLLEVSPEALLQALPAHLLPPATPVAVLGPVDAGGTELPLGTTLPGVSGGSRRGGVGWVLLILFLLALLGLAAYLFFNWWLPRSQGQIDESSVSLPFAIESQIGAESSSGATGSIVAPVVAPTVPPAVPLAEDPAGVEQPPAPETASAGAPVTTAATPAANNPAAPGAAPQSADASANDQAARSPTGPFVVPGMTPAAAPATEPEPPPPPPVPDNLIGFEVNAASWVEVRDAENNVALSATLQPGETRQLEVDPPARIVIGNANGITLSWQGQPVDLASHQRGNVARLTLE